MLFHLILSPLSFRGQGAREHVGKGLATSQGQPITDTKGAILVSRKLKANNHKPLGQQGTARSVSFTERVNKLCKEPQ